MHVYTKFPQCELGCVKCIYNVYLSGVGKRSNRWSAVTIRLALAVYCRSPAAYDALKSFGLLQLPSRSTLQAFTGAFLEDCGEHYCFSLMFIYK